MAFGQILDPYDSAVNLRQKTSGEKKLGLRRQGSVRKSARQSLSGSVDDRGWSLLHVAAKAGKLEEVSKILESGANANEVSHGPKSPGATPLHLAASGGHLEVMDLLLEHGADIEAKTKGAVCGWTPLHSAAKEGNNKKAIRFLIENGAFLAPDMGDVRFNPPLHYCPGLEYAYKFNKKMQARDSSGSGEDERDE